MLRCTLRSPAACAALHPQVSCNFSHQPPTMNRRHLLGFPLAFIATGCASQLTLPNLSPDSDLPDGSALLVTRIVLTDAVPGVSQRPEASLSLIGEKNLLVSSAVVPLSTGENFRAIVLPAGNYNWRGLYMGTSHAEFRGRLPFKLLKNSACYVGDLDFQVDWSNRTYRLAIRDRFRIAQGRYEDQYRKLAQSVPLTPSLTQDFRT